MTLILNNCQLLDPQGTLQKVDILCENGKIKKIGRIGQAEGRIDLNSKIVLPGLIDAHVHLREPGATHKEDFLSGGKAAAKGGVTTIFEMPNTDPPTVTLKTLENKRLLAKKCPVNCFSYFGATLDNLPTIAKLNKKKEAIGVKVYLGSSTGNLLVNDYEYLSAILKTYHGIVAIHAEDEAIIRKNSEKHKGRTEPWIHAEIRSNKAAMVAVSNALKALKDDGGKLYITHISTREEIALIERAKKDGLSVYAEVTPHHLFLNKASLHTKGNLAKMNPPLRSAVDQKALWEALHAGIIDTIGTDHAPHLLTEKEQEYSQAPAGVPGLETMLPLLLNAYQHHQISLAEIIKLTATNPARIFGLKNKGQIKEGFDADLTVVDLDLEKQVRNQELVTKCGWSPFSGWQLKGWPVMTIVAGKIIYRAEGY